MNKPDEDLDALFGAARRDLPPVDAGRVARVALASGVAAPSAWRSLWPKLALATVVTAVGALGVWHIGGNASAPPITPAQLAPPVALTPTLALAPPRAPEATREAAPPSPEPRRPARVREVVPAPPREAVPAPPSESEVALQEGAVLLRARRALGRNEPEVALAACEEHAQSFETGRLAPEREAIAIDALNALGRADQARARAQRFIAHWPESATPTEPVARWPSRRTTTMSIA